MDKTFLSDFSNPPSQYRGAPFWAWNGKLEPEELRRQIRVMKQMGLGGFFMHARVGLNTDYLSDQWFECVDACVDEAEKLGMKAWLYDEDRWPSGSAGGLVTKNPKYRQKFLLMHRTEPGKTFTKPDKTVAIFAATIEGDTIVAMRRLGGRGAVRARAGETLLAFSIEMPANSSWFNNQTYLDTISHEAVSEFVRVTHEAYRKNQGKHFGRTIPGIFTDEPNCGPFFTGMARGDAIHRVKIWTPDLPKIFKQRYGFDLLDRLPELYFDRAEADSARVRWCFGDCVSHLFATAYAGVIGQWCEKNGMLHTGHVLSEDSPTGQVLQDGSCMRFYEHMQAPGMDLLTQYTRWWDTAKQVSSAARQFDRPWRLTETYGCTGWDFPLAGHKALGDWQAALGINLRCQHLTWYTMTGQAKRDYPAGIHEHSPWWRSYPVIENYFARVHAAMTRGVEVRDVLVIHPNESIFLHSHTDMGANPACRRIDKATVALRDSLIVAGIDFDYGDEDILARHGHVSGKGKKALLHVAKAPYRVVVVPPLDTIRSSTLSLLERFADAGGTVVFAGKPAALVDATASDAAAELAGRCTAAAAAGPRLAAAVEGRGRRISVVDPDGRQAPGLLSLLRQDRDFTYLFLCNTGHEVTGLDGVPVFSGQRGNLNDVHVLERRTGYESLSVRLLEGAVGEAVELDPADGQIYSTGSNVKANKKACELKTSLAPLGSRIFVFPRTAAAAGRLARLKAPRRASFKAARKLAAPAAKAGWDYVLDEPNCLVLDRPTLKLRSGKTQPPEEVLRVDATIRKALGIQPRGGRMCQPWAVEHNPEPRSIPVELTYRFEVKTLPGGPLRLAMEHPEAFSEILVNGQALDSASDCGWWVDNSLRTLPVDPSVLHVGENLVTMTLDYDEYFDGLEIVYLLGGFGVKLAADKMTCTITELPQKLKLGDWTRQGLTFYGGNVSYRRRIAPKLAKGERLVLSAGEYDGTALRVLVDGREAGVLAWPGAELDLTDLLGEGPATLDVQVLGHRRNSHGPLHLGDKRPRWVGPGQFDCEPKDWTDGYTLVACGLKQPPTLEIRK